MNKKRLLAVADHIEPLPTVKARDFEHATRCSPRKIRRFTMKACSETFECGSAGCIAGVAVLLFGTEEDNVPSSARSIMDIAQKILGLTASQAENLFVPSGSLWDITPQEAAKAIRLFVNTPHCAWEAWEAARGGRE